VYLPYLHWDSFENLQKRAKVIDRRRKQTYARPVPEDIVNGKSLEHKLIWQYLTSDGPVHCRRTLDQYGYPSLRNTAVRDRDQILYKWTRVDQQVPQEPGSIPKLPPRRSPAGQATVQPPADNDEAAKVLMVDQLWLWILDKSTVVTFFASKEQEEKDRSLRGEGNLRNEIYRDINGDLANQCADPFDFAALAVYHAVKVLLDRTIDRNLQVFEIFEEYINILTEQQNASFKGFRNDHGFEHAKSDAESHLDNRKDLDALLELRDIDDELTMIERLVKEQQECVKEMLKQYQHLHDHHGGKGANGIDFLRKTHQTLSENKERIASMLKSAHAAQKAFKDLLDMKQKQATIVEART
jgi:Mg2+ and Co2+ transporter CorA